MKRRTIQTENINLVRKIVWNYKKTTRESYEDLFQEGYVGFLRAIETHDPTKGAFSTYAWHCISTEIKDYLRFVNNRTKMYELAKEFADMEIETLDTIPPPSEFFENLPKEAYDIATLVLAAPKRFVVRTQREVKEMLIEMLLKEGWPKEKIRFGLKQLTRACN